MSTCAVLDRRDALVGRDGPELTASGSPRMSSAMRVHQVDVEALELRLAAVRVAVAPAVAVLVDADDQLAASRPDGLDRRRSSGRRRRRRTGSASPGPCSRPPRGRRPPAWPRGLAGRLRAGVRGPGRRRAGSSEGEDARRGRRPPPSRPPRPSPSGGPAGVVRHRHRLLRLVVPRVAGSPVLRQPAADAQHRARRAQHREHRRARPAARQRVRGRRRPPA